MGLDWSTIATEGGRGLLFLLVMVYLTMVARRRDLGDKPGWGAILGGFAVLVVQAALVVLNQVPAVRWEGVLMGLSTRQLLYNTLLPMVGAGLVLYGFGKYLVYPARLAEARRALEQANERLEERVARATASLQASNRALASERASLALFRELLDQSNDAIFIMDTETGRFIDVNQTACDRLGYTRAELLGLMVWNVEVTILGQAAFEEHVAEMEGARTLTALGTHVAKDGTRIPVETTVQYAAKGQDTYLVAICRDITERTNALQEAKAHMEMLETLFQASPEPIIAVDREGCVTLWNPAAEVVFGWSCDEVLGRPNPIIPPGDESFGKAFEQALQGDPYHAQAIPRRTRTGEIRRFNLSVAPLRHVDGSPKGGVAVLSDVTAQIEAEASKRRALEVEKEVEHLREMDQFKTRFLNTAAHELATPLTPVRFQLRALSEGLLGELASGQAEAVSIVERNILRLERLVSDLLDSTRLQGGRLKIEPRAVDVSTLLEEMVQDFQPLMVEANLTLETSIEPALGARVDPDRLGQVVANLLDNTTKYTPAGGGVELTAERQGDTIRIEVQDDGVGLEGDQAHQVFEPFTQLHRSRDRLREGTGLGLYIARGIVEQHGGSMGAHSQGPGQGCTFWLVFPARAPAPSTAGREGLGEAQA